MADWPFSDVHVTAESGAAPIGCETIRARGIWGSAADSPPGTGEANPRVAWAVSSMTETNSESGGGKYFPALLLLFVGSGCAALVYEVVWFHILRLTIGATTVSIGVLLASFMGGMCAGSLLFPLIVSARFHPLRVYAVLEIAIGALGVVLLFALPVIGNVYAESVGYGSAGILMRAAVCAGGLLAPTILMGATLPALSRWMETSKIGVSRMGFFYGANIAGAVLGTTLAGFYLLRLFDTHIATYFSAALNVVVAVVAILLAMRAPYTPAKRMAKTVDKSGSRAGVYTVIGLSGAVSMGAQVVWTRLLALLFGATIYTFTLILAVFLIGLGVGSALGSWAARKLERPGVALLACQVAAIGCVAFASLGINIIVPGLKVPVDAGMYDSPNRGMRYFVDLLLIAVAILPATLAWGASFPLALATAARRADDPGHLVGRVYAANTVGAIFGSLFFAIVAIPWLGTGDAQRVMAGLAAAGAFIMFFAIWRSAESKGAPAWQWPTAIVVTIALALVIIRPAPNGMIAFGREVGRWGEAQQYYYVAEGQDASIAVSRSTYGHQNFPRLGQSRGVKPPNRHADSTHARSHSPRSCTKIRRPCSSSGAARASPRGRSCRIPASNAS
jgi:spermidine synthase